VTRPVCERQRYWGDQLVLKMLPRRLVTRSAFVVITKGYITKGYIATMSRMFPKTGTRVPRRCWSECPTRNYLSLHAVPRLRLALEESVRRWISAIPQVLCQLPAIEIKGKVLNQATVIVESKNGAYWQVVGMMFLVRHNG
jgi:hypothetical protein